MPARTVDDGPSRADIRAMRQHLNEVDWSDATPAQIARMPREQVEGAVERHYSGGVRQFLRDGGAQ